MIQKSKSLKYEPSSEPLRISPRNRFTDEEKRQAEEEGARPAAGRKRQHAEKILDSNPSALKSPASLFSDQTPGWLSSEQVDSS